MKNISLIIGILLIFYSIALYLTVGRISFSSVLLLAGILLVIYFFTEKYFLKFKWFYWTKKIAIPILGIVLVIFLIVELAILFYGLKKDKEKTDYIVILGAALNGKEMSLALKQRVDTALDYLKSNDNGEMIVVSGGQGKGEDISEAQAMKNYLVAKGINEDRIIIEDKSTNTYENFKFSKEKIIENSNKPIEDISIKIVTNNFHCLRSSLLAKRNGFKNVYIYSAPLSIGIVPNYYLREFFALGKSIVFDR